MTQIGTPTPAPRLRIVVIGAGQIGSTFASRFARNGGHDVTAVARPGSARLAQCNGTELSLTSTAPAQRFVCSTSLG
jgi:ketopantoate reductase